MDVWYHIQQPGHQPNLLSDFVGSNVDDLRHAIKEREQRKLLMFPASDIRLEICHPSDSTAEYLNEGLLIRLGGIPNLLRTFQISYTNPLIVLTPGKWQVFECTAAMLFVTTNHRHSNLFVIHLSYTADKLESQQGIIPHLSLISVYIIGAWVMIYSSLLEYQITVDRYEKR